MKKKTTRLISSLFMKSKKLIFSLFLVFVMVLNLIPVVVFAAGDYDAEFTPSIIDCGEMYTDYVPTACQKNVYIKNTGSESWTYNNDSISLSGTNADSFLYGWALTTVGGSVSPGETIESSIYVRPKSNLSVGTYTAVLTFKDTEGHITKTSNVSFTVKDDSERVYTVTTLISGDGSGSVSVSPSSGGVTGTEITLTATPNAGSKFSKWIVKEGEITLANENSATTTFSIGTKNVRVEAVFEEDDSVYVMKFYSNGGSGDMTSVAVPKNSNYSLPTCTFTPPTGQNFDYWKINGANYAVGANYYMSSNVTAFAWWKDTAYPSSISSIVINVTEPVVGANPLLTATTDSTECTITGGALAGWQDLADNTILSSADVFQAGHTYRATVWLEPASGYTIEDSTNVTINGKTATLSTKTGSTAQYYCDFTVSATTCTVTLDPNNGTSETSALSGIPNGGSITIGSPSSYGFTTPTGKDFDGWLIYGAKYDVGQIITITSDATAIAQWKDSGVTAYPVWVGGTQVTDANKDNILGDGKVSYTPGEGAGTLTITGTPAITGLHENALIYADGIDLTINAASGLTLNSTGSGVYVNGDVTINGDASINTTGISINCIGDVTITGALTATARSNYTVFSNGNISIGGNAELKNTYLGGYGLCAPNGGITVDGDITVNAPAYALYAGSGTIRINGDANLNTSRNPINCSGDVTITGSLTATAEGNYTVFSNGNISIGGNAELKNTYLGGYGLCAPNGGITVDGDITVNAPAYALYAGSGTIRINGDANLNTSRNPINCSGDVTITGSLTATAEGNYTVFSNGNISIGGNAELKNTYSGGYGLCAPYGKITMTSGVWDITAGNYAIYAKNGIEIPSTHEVTTPTGGKIAQVTEGSNTFYTVTEADGTTVAKHAIIEPKAALTYTVTFDANGGTGSMADVTGISGEYTLPTNGFTAPDGKQFKAWSVGGVEKAAGDTITVNANTTVTAIWEDIPVTYYTVTFDANGGSAVTAQTIEAGQKATKPADPTKDGYDFKGWTLNGSAYDFNSAVNGNITLVATWEAKQVVPTTYTVSFAANGGTGSMADVTGISGEYTLPANGFTAPEGKQFKAWSVGGVEKAVGDKITVTADTTVTAVWETIPAGHTCDIKPVAKVEPSCTEGGKEAYYKCEGCGKFYEDALGAKEITDLAAWGNLEKLGHTESGWKSDKDNHWKECTVAGCGVIIENSKAAHKDDNNDGKCDVCEYNVGTTTTKPEDTNKPSDDVQSPQTGDNSMMWLWVALLFVSGFGVVATTVYGKRRTARK